MQPQVAVRPNDIAPVSHGLVLAVLATDQERLRSVLRRVTAEPRLVAVLTRVVVLDIGRTPAATVLREAVRLPAGLLRVVRRPDAMRPEALAGALAEAVKDPGASSVLVLDDTALSEAAGLLEAYTTARRSTASDVVGLRAPDAVDPGPASWWGALLPLDAVRALGGTLPEAGEVALAELVLRAESAGFRPAVVSAPGPVPTVAETDRLLLALLHAPLGARTAFLMDGAAEDLRLLLALRFRDVAMRRNALAPLLGARSAAPRLRLWSAWRGLRRRVRSGAVVRASAEEWSLRLRDPRMNREWTSGERREAVGRRAGLRSTPWPTTKRETSAA